MLRKWILIGFGAISAFSADVQLVASSAEIRDFFGTDSVRLAFVESKWIRVVDFSAASPTIQSLSGTSGAIAPQFSPQGDWLVYGLGPNSDMTNNINTKSSAYLVPFQGGTPTLAVADMAHEPRFRRNSSGNPELVYSTIGVWNGWSSSGETRILPVNLSSSTPSLGTSSVLLSGAYYGGANDDYVATGSTRAIMSSISNSNPQITLAYSLTSLNGVVNSNERQACNTSIYPGTEYSNGMLSLDFGSAGMTNSSIHQGKAWGLHDILFFTLYDGTMLAHWTRPDRNAFSLFADDSYVGHHYDDVEWSNHPYFAVANIQVTRSYLVGDEWFDEEPHEVIVAIDLRSGKHLALAQSSTVGQGISADLVWPNLWVNRNAAPKIIDNWVQQSNSIQPHTNADLPSAILQVYHHQIHSKKPLQTLVSYDMQGKAHSWISNAAGTMWKAPVGIQGVHRVVAIDSKGNHYQQLWIQDSYDP